MLNDQVKDLKKQLASENIPGLALDIDETLSQTIGWWVERMQTLFGNPEGLTKHELIAKYRYTQNVPYWQTEPAKKWMEERMFDVQLQTELELIQDADKMVDKINKIIPIKMYLTIRPEEVNSGTEIWLKKHGFPPAKIIARPKNIPRSDGNQWKAEILEYLYPKIQGIIDDNVSLLEKLSPQYKGIIFAYDYQEKLDRAISCPTWNDVYQQVKKVF